MAGDCKRRQPRCRSGERRGFAASGHCKAPPFDRRLPADYLKQFLANPAIAPQSGTARMPNLGLAPQEIAALAEFLTAERHALR